MRPDIGLDNQLIAGVAPTLKAAVWGGERLPVVEIIHLRHCIHRLIAGVVTVSAGMTVPQLVGAVVVAVGKHNGSRQIAQPGGCLRIGCIDCEGIALFLQ